MLNFAWISAIGVGVLAVWPTSLFVRRWWLKPYRKPYRILNRLQRSLRLTRGEARHLKTLLGKNADPVLASQFLLDPGRWQITLADESTKKLYSKVFKQP